MADREKVIKELDDSLKNQHCGFVDGVGDVYAVSEETIKNIIALLKEQEPKPVGKEWNECPNCGKVLSSIEHIHFCGMCGRPVKWE